MRDEIRSVGYGLLPLLLILTVLVTLPFHVFGQSAQTDSSYNNNANGYVVFVPANWNKIESEYTALKGGTVNRVILIQTTDIVSRPTKYFLMLSGKPGSIFGLSDSVVQRVTQDQLVNFYIDQYENSSIDYQVSKTYTTGTGENKVYVIEASEAAPGYRAFSVTHIQFKKGKVYVWYMWYLSTFSTYAPLLQKISDSVQIM
jgi:hypothetical protein